MEQVTKPTFQNDAVLSQTHSLKIEVPSPDELMTIFDGLTYGKGSIVCRLLAQFIGPDIFQKCLCTYINRFKFKNATTADLLAVFDEVTDAQLPHVSQDGKQVSVSQYIKPWIEQSCFPVV